MYPDHRETGARRPDQQPQALDKSLSRLVSELLPLGCLSILREEETGLLDQEKSQSREYLLWQTTRHACELVYEAKHFDEPTKAWHHEIIEHSRASHNHHNTL